MEVSQYGTGRINQYMVQNGHLIRNFFKILLFKALIDIIKNRIVMLQI